MATLSTSRTRGFNSSWNSGDVSVPSSGSSIVARSDKTMTTSEGSPLGRPTDYPDRYDPALLFPIARSDARQALGITGALPFGGADLWTAYEMSWLDRGGKPQAAVGRLRIAADSPCLVDSKTRKAYLRRSAREPVPIPAGTP